MNVRGMDQVELIWKTSIKYLQPFGMMERYPPSSPFQIPSNVSRSEFWCFNVPPITHGWPFISINLTNNHMIYSTMPQSISLGSKYVMRELYGVIDHI